MTTTLSSLLNPQSAAVYENDIKQSFDAYGFPTSAWQPGSMGTTLLKTEAQVLSELDATIAQIAKGGFVSEATKEWLTLLAQDRFGLTRAPATYAIGSINLWVAPNVASPGTFGPGAIIVASSNDPSLRYISTASVTLPNGGTDAPVPVQVAVRAEQPGQAYSNRTDLTILNTAIPGVSVTSDGPTVGGAERQGDESLAAACRARWSTLGTGATAEQIKLWAIYATNASGMSSGITDALCEEIPPGTGTVAVYCTSGGAAASDDGVAIAQSYISERMPICMVADVQPAAVVTITITGHIIALPSAASGARDAAAAALQSYVASQKVGGEPLGEPDGGSRGVAYERMVQQFMSVPGIQNLANVIVTVGETPPGASVTDSNDVVLASSQIVAFDIQHMDVLLTG